MSLDSRSSRWTSAVAAKIRPNGSLWMSGSAAAAMAIVECGTQGGASLASQQFTRAPQSGQRSAICVHDTISCSSSLPHCLQRPGMRRNSTWPPMTMVGIEDREAEAIRADPLRFGDVQKRRGGGRLHGRQCTTRRDKVGPRGHQPRSFPTQLVRADRLQRHATAELAGVPPAPGVEFRGGHVSAVSGSKQP